MKNLLFAIALITTISCSSGENNYSKMLDWMGKIPKGTSIDSVKKTQPDFVTVDWESRDTLSCSQNVRFEVKPLHYFDILQMSNYLTFDSSGYRGRGYSR
jgi:hypothetical protein